MQLPRRMIDLSSPLDNETILDHPFMRPKIEYRTNAENAPMLLDIFPGLRREDLPDGEGWAFELVQLTTHNGTHMDAPVHYQSKTIDGKPMMTIDQVPLDPIEAIDKLWRPISKEQLERRVEGKPLTHRLVRLPHVSRRSSRVLGPVSGLIVDG